MSLSADAVFSMGRLRSAYAGLASPGECVALAYDRIARHRGNPIWITLVPRDEAMARAAALEREGASGRGPLWGIPFAVKDNIDVAGMPTTAACPQFAYVPNGHARVVERLLDAGAILIGKTNLDQFATGLVGTRSPYGACRNAFDARYISGGSSSGSAVAVALGEVCFALGTDTAGSGRVPAAFNNVVGLKPTRGAISTQGVVPACRSLDCVSVFANDCADALEVLRIARAYDREDAYSRRFEPRSATIAADQRRCAVPRADQREFFGDLESARLFDAAIARLAALGFEPVEADYTPFLQAQRLLYDGPWVAERRAAIGAFYARHPDALDPVVGGIIERAARFSAVDAFEGTYRLAELRRATEPLWQQVTMMLVPAAPTIYTIEQVAAQPVELNARLGWYTNFVNLLDLAAVNVPAGFRADGLPFGVSLIGPAHADEVLAHIGGRLHAALRMPSGIGTNAHPAQAPIAPRASAPVRLAVVGAHLSGLPLNGQLTARRAQLLRAARTARCYRLYALDGGAVPRPGMVRVAADEGGAIEVEVWELAVDQFGGLVAEVPPPLGIGTIELEDGEQVKGFLCEHYAVQGTTDITPWGGWRGWLAHSRAGQRTN